MRYLKLYKCEDCNNEFEYPNNAKEAVGEAWGVMQYQDIMCCPCCDSTDLVKVELCACKEEKKTNDKHCDNCMEIAETAWKMALEYVQKNITYSEEESTELIIHYLES